VSRSSGPQGWFARCLCLMSSSGGLVRNRHAATPSAAAHHPPAPPSLEGRLAPDRKEDGMRLRRLVTIGLTAYAGWKRLSSQRMASVRAGR